jgi:hypothetical protein
MPEKIRYPEKSKTSSFGIGLGKPTSWRNIRMNIAR